MIIALRCDGRDHVLTGVLRYAVTGTSVRVHTSHAPPTGSRTLLFSGVRSVDVLRTPEGGAS